MSTVMLPAVREEQAPETSLKEDLQSALDLIREEGWVQGVASCPNGRGGKKHCALGAAWEVMDDDPVRYSRMALALIDAIGERRGEDFVWSFGKKDGTKVHFLCPEVSAVARWNDEFARTQEQVEMIFEHAIEKAES